MLRAALVVLFASIVALGAASVVLLRSNEAGPVPEAPGAFLAGFERAHAPTRQVDLGTRYAGRFELIDPKKTPPNANDVWRSSRRANL